MVISPIILKVLIGALITIGVVAVIVITILTLPTLKKLIRERKEKKQQQIVAFGDTRKIINDNAIEILKRAPKMTLDDLEKLCEDTPYFVVDYDPSTEKLTSEVEGIKVEQTREDVKTFIDQNEEDGIVLFD